MTGKHIHGGTTISGTMILSQLAGIRIFGTGGLGKINSAESPCPITHCACRRRPPWWRELNGYFWCDMESLPILRELND